MVAAGLVLTGCTAAVPVAPAPSAADPACATLARQAPAVVAGLASRDTTAQAALAWGPGGPAAPAVSGEVVVRCGVVPPGPTTAACTSVTSGDLEVDWISATSGSGSAFTTYGRSPAVAVTIPASLTDADPAIAQSVLADLAPAVTTIAAQRRCIGPEDATEVPEVLEVPEVSEPAGSSGATGVPG